MKKLGSEILGFRDDFIDSERRFKHFLTRISESKNTIGENNSFPNFKIIVFAADPNEL